MAHKIYTIDVLNPELGVLLHFDPSRALGKSWLVITLCHIQRLLFGGLCRWPTGRVT